MALCHIEPTGIDITEFSFGRLRNTDQPCAGGRVKYKITVINNGDQDQDIELTEWIGNTYLEDEALTGKTKETVMVKAHSSWVDEREMQVLNWPSAWYYVKVKLTYSLQSTAILSYDAFWLDQCVPSGGGIASNSERKALSPTLATIRSNISQNSSSFFVCEIKICSFFIVF